MIGFRVHNGEIFAYDSYPERVFRFIDGNVLHGIHNLGVSFFYVFQPLCFSKISQISFMGSFKIAVVDFKAHILAHIIFYFVHLDDHFRRGGKRF